MNQSTLPTSITSPLISMEDQARHCDPSEGSIEFSVLLKKPPGRPNAGLGITIVGYVSGDPEHPIKDKGRMVVCFMLANFWLFQL